MEIKGDMRVRRTLTADRRVNQGLRTAVITALENFGVHSSWWQRLSAAAPQDAVLPDATTLPNGWKIVVEASGASAITVQDNGNNDLQEIPTGKAYEVTLLDNGTANGAWHLNYLEDSSQVVAMRYVAAFDGTTDWGTAAGGYYSQTVDQATHGRGTSPVAQVFEEDGSDFVEVHLDQKKVLANGDVVMRVPEDPDIRFAGKLVLI